MAEPNQSYFLVKKLLNLFFIKLMENGWNECQK